MRIKSDFSTGESVQFYDTLFKVNILCDEILRTLGVIEYAIMSIKGNKGDYGKYLSVSLKEAVNDFSEAKKCLKKCLEDAKTVENTLYYNYKKNELNLYVNSSSFDDIIKSYTDAIESADRTIKSAVKANDANVEDIKDQLCELKRKAESIKEKLLRWKEFANS